MHKRPEYDIKAIGKRLRHFRCQKGMTVEDVRKYMYLGSVQSVYKWESGASLPAVDNFLALLDLYGVELKDIVVELDETNHEVKKICCVIERMSRLGWIDYVVYV